MIVVSRLLARKTTAVATTSPAVSREISFPARKYSLPCRQQQCRESRLKSLSLSLGARRFSCSFHAHRGKFTNSARTDSPKNVLHQDYVSLQTLELLVSLILTVTDKTVYFRMFQTQIHKNCSGTISATIVYPTCACGFIM